MELLSQNNTFMLQAKKKRDTKGKEKSVMHVLAILLQIMSNGEHSSQVKYACLKEAVGHSVS